MPTLLSEHFQNSFAHATINENDDQRQGWHHGARAIGKLRRNGNYTLKEY